MSLQYLDFDYHEDVQGQGTFEAMATVPAARLPALQAEIAQVLDWAHATFPGQGAAAEEGGEWDYQLDAQQEWSVPETLDYDAVARRFSSRPGTAGPVRHALTLTISGTAGFCDALRRRFGL
jgi:hypothetical protein